jgi:isocitrate dehydrogenase
MKISDQLFFGAIVEVFFALYSKNSTLFTELNIDTRNGLGDVCKIAGHPQQTEVEAAITQTVKMVQV